MVDMLMRLLQDMCLSAIPAVGFALLFNVPVYVLHCCAILGALGHSVRMVLVMASMPLVFATFLGALVIGFCGIGLGKYYHIPPKVLTVAAVIPMVPGIYAYRAMIALLDIQQLGFSDELFRVLVENFIQTGFLLSALVFGLALPGLLFYRTKPVV